MGHVTLTPPTLVVICHYYCHYYYYYYYKICVGHKFKHARVGGVAIHMLGLDIAYLCSKFNHSAFSHSRDMVGAHQNLNSSRDLTTPLSVMICYPRASTCYDQP